MVNGSVKLKAGSSASTVYGVPHNHPKIRLDLFNRQRVRLLLLEVEHWRILILKPFAVSFVFIIIASCVHLSFCIPVQPSGASRSFPFMLLVHKEIDVELVPR